VSLSPLERYEHEIQQGILQKDEYQYQAVRLLQKMYNLILEHHQAKQKSSAGSSLADTTGKLSISGLLAWVKSSLQSSNASNELKDHNRLQGCYIWGGVGRGKTHLMDCFYESLPIANKKRIHFHRFMRFIHKELDAHKGHANPLQTIAQNYAQKYQVLCLDEFVVIDITDAMLLGGLVKTFFEAGLYLITTSNVPPADLYKDGLQRSRFLPAIDLLANNLEVFHLDSHVDYRLRQLQQQSLYVVGDQQHGVLTAIFNAQSPNGLIAAKTLEVNNRSIQALAMHDDVAWFTFKQLCEGARSVSDYIELTRELHTIIVSQVPIMNAANEDAARRFVHLVDEFYDSRVKLILGAALPIDEIYQGTKLAFEFERTISRVIEMQSDDYLAAPHRLDCELK